MKAYEYVEQAMDILGGEDSDFTLTVSNCKVLLRCGYSDCQWGMSIGEMELWEFITDAREHWDDAHA